MHRAGGVLVLVLMRRHRCYRCCGLVVVVVVVGFREERRVLEGREGGVEAAAEGLGERAGVFGNSCACGGHDLEIRRVLLRR